MRVRVGVRDKHIDVQLGAGSQSLLWLANAALCRYDRSMGLELGPPLGLRLEDGTQLPLHCAVADYIADGGQVFVVLSKEEELEDDAAKAGDNADDDEAADDRDDDDDGARQPDDDEQ